MSTTTTQTNIPSIPDYVVVPETSEILDWADLATLDLSKFNEPGGKEALAAELAVAIETIGFFYVSNYGLTSKDIDRQYALARSVTSLSDEQKQPYRAALEAGDYNGWKPAGIRESLPGIRDNYEIYNIPKFIPEHRDRAHPEVVTQNFGEIERFSKHIHNEIVKKLLVLFALVLKLEDEDYFVRLHRYEAASGDHLRYMKYYHRSAEENEKLGNLWLKGHSDMGSLTLLFRQPVAALQVLTPTGKWKWVKPQENALTVNIADGLQFLTNGFLKSSIHRVVAPPKDQAHIDRLGVIYMVRLEDDTELLPIEDSPVLRERGLVSEKILGEDGKPLKAGDWVKARVIKNIGATSGKEGDHAVSDVEVLKGVKMTYFD
ncbi:putative 1-aminocyclopropane-1-carboxylate oxidase [Pleomassaria siparia CBS 279.74]|uniref:Putative 1-aminocyclopropane-1-carboxylate oxidase n=1 Tax=Pleomassaria siparia CBS 279.74 TaxID=1314801 RepID=A0A6G1KBU3_9PLEO|nr:putative 1-aminocyclopropane-1-carboxylate oxidase [Pleomassaria siparia CBS 279.74]